MIISTLCPYAECVIILNAVVLSVVILNVAAPCYEADSAVGLFLA
jgi:hypothetical protein